MPFHITLSYFSYSREYLINVEIKATRVHPLFHSYLSLSLSLSLHLHLYLIISIHTYVLYWCVSMNEREKERI